MASKRTPRVEVLRFVSRFIAVLAVLVALTALAQVPAGNQRHAESTLTTRDSAVPNDSSITLRFLPVVTYDSGGQGASAKQWPT